MDGFKRYCDHGTKQECRRKSNRDHTCNKVHFKHIINGHTEKHLGDCSYLNTCHRMGSCKYMHYSLDATAEELEPILQHKIQSPFVSASIICVNDMLFIEY